MSASLLRKGLDLLGTPPERRVPPGTRGRGQGSTKASRLQPSQRRSGWKRKAAPKLKQPTVKGKVARSVVEEFRKHRARNHLKANLRFMRHTCDIADPQVTKILMQNQGRKAKDQPAKMGKKQQRPQGTVFTEEDFRKFEREYFGTTGAK
ncbi:active regulator of SIRT1 [Tachyglossus aculeatus]|uniref:active regulator of SIRT1 n=1 Tax=Tachyglossus aculeatus TaxID=9261 RepID=UPI0018F6E3F3|nr:active regulator of SIRT1 [Tachyglossus aculeatus]